MSYRQPPPPPIPPPPPQQGQGFAPPLPPPPPPSSHAPPLLPPLPPDHHPLQPPLPPNQPPLPATQPRFPSNKPPLPANQPPLPSLPPSQPPLPVSQPPLPCNQPPPPSKQPPPPPPTATPPPWESGLVQPPLPPPGNNLVNRSTSGEMPKRRGFHGMGVASAEAPPPNTIYGKDNERYCPAQNETTYGGSSVGVNLSSRAPQNQPAPRPLFQPHPPQDTSSNVPRPPRDTPSSVPYPPQGTLSNEPRPPSMMPHPLMQPSSQTPDNLPQPRPLFSTPPRTSLETFSERSQEPSSDYGGYNGDRRDYSSGRGGNWGVSVDPDFSSDDVPPGDCGWQQADGPTYAEERSGIGRSYSRGRADHTFHERREDFYDRSTDFPRGVNDSDPSMGRYGPGIHGEGRVRPSSQDYQHGTEYDDAPGNRGPHPLAFSAGPMGDSEMNREYRSGHHTSAFATGATDESCEGHQGSRAGPRPPAFAAGATDETSVEKKDSDQSGPRPPVFAAGARDETAEGKKDSQSKSDHSNRSNSARDDWSSDYYGDEPCWHGDGPGGHGDGPGEHDDGPGWHSDRPGGRSDGPGWHGDGPSWRGDGPGWRGDGGGRYPGGRESDWNEGAPQRSPLMDPPHDRAPHPPPPWAPRDNRPQWDNEPTWAQYENQPPHRSPWTQQRANWAPHYDRHYPPQQRDYPPPGPAGGPRYDDQRQGDYRVANILPGERSVDHMGVPPARMPEAKVVPADKILDTPGRSSRPSHIVIILRGLPGSGKSHIAKLIKDKEVASGGQPPRILSLDAYFMNEVEKVEKDPDTGRRIKKKVEEYEYDEEMEPSFRKSLFKAFNKTLDEGFFPMIIVDAINHKMCHYDRYWSNAKMKGFEVYIAELREDIDVCVERNCHNRTRKEIEKLAHQWEDTPVHFLRLDIGPLISDSNIDEIEMECASSDDDEEKPAAESTEDAPQNAVVKSRWEEAAEDKLDKLDDVGSLRKRKRLHSELEEDTEELSLTEYLARKMKDQEGPKKKMVRWADLEAIKDEERRKKVGFVIGSGWSKVSEEEAQNLLMGQTN